MKKIILILFAVGAFGCASNITFNEYAPDIKAYKPTELLIFPTTVGAYEKANKAVNEATAKSAEEVGKYAAVISPDMVLRKMNDDPELQMIIVDYISRLNMLGLSDADKLQRIGQTFNVNAVMLVNLSDWSVTELSGENIYRVAIDMKIVDTATNVIIWKAGGSLPKAASSLLSKPDLAEMAEELSLSLIEQAPPK